jgi:hypothetical protein
MKLLKLDIDFHPPKKWLEEWLKTRDDMLYCLGYDVERMDVFKTARGIHVYIKLKQNIRDAEANKLQFLLGDDPTRVKINQWRIKNKIKHWNKLFEKVLYRRKTKTLKCHYCGNIIPLPEKP